MIQGQEDPMQISTIGVDIGKNSFHFVGFDTRGGIVVRRQCSRTQLIRALANLPPCLVGMEACCGAHAHRLRPPLAGPAVSTLSRWRS